MSITGPGSITAANLAAQTSMFKQLDSLSEQLGTGQAAQTYAGLGSQAGLALELGTQLSAFNGYSTTATTVGTTLTVAQSVLTQIGSTGSAVEQALSQQPAFSLDNNGQTSTQESAASDFDQIVDLLNTQSGDNYLFSGSAVAQPSVASASLILNGNGSQAGVTQVIAQRQQADLGTSGLGRLSISASGTTVAVDQDGSPFGFQIAGVTSNLTGATVTGPTGSPPSISASLSSNPNDGDTIQLELALPDGSSRTVSLEATTSTSPGADQFSIGANPQATAANLANALTSAVTGLAQTALPAASAVAASENFFSGAPQRVNGPPYDSAMSLVAATPADTVSWYTGENGSTPPRQTATAQVGPSMTIAYGMRANEPAFTSMLAAVAALAATSYSASDPNAQSSYQALCQSVQTSLEGQPGTQTVESIESDLANAQITVSNASTLNSQTQSTLQGMLQGIEGVDQNKIGEQILTLQNSLQASMSVTARLAQLSLVNYLGPASG